MNEATLPRGVLAVTTLPAASHQGRWESIVVPIELKDTLVASALLSLLHGPRLGNLPGSPSGLVVLAGPPGTGKTTLAHGLAQVAAEAVAESGPTTLVEIDAHSLPSEMLGESQRNVARLLGDAIPGVTAGSEHTVVLVDEVESFAVGRRAASFETNPVDVHRATDAVLEGMDRIAGATPGVLFVTTTNFVAAVDEAFLSRADLVVELGLPDRLARSEIVRRSLADLAGIWPAFESLAADGALHDSLASLTEGWDGRRLRKLPLRALGGSPRLALQPASICASDLYEVVKRRS